MTREELAERAIELAGGESGWTHSHDPEGLFRLVTEGRQSWHGYSACEDLATRLCLEAAGGPGATGVDWCNRVDAGNRWIPGANLLRIQTRAPQHWHSWRGSARWQAGLGDPVQIMGRFAHTLIIVALERGDDGRPRSVDVAEYGQYIDPDGSGPERADHGCRVRRGVPVAWRDGRWWIGSGHVLGHVDIVGLAARDTLPAPPPVAGEVAEARMLRVGAQGGDVAEIQRALGVVPDGRYGPATAGAVRAWQAAHGLTADGVVGPATRRAMGRPS